jgi:PPM family protein phosphatase
MRFKVGARTDVGRVREGNEDSYMVHEPLFAVADGMGGHQGGEVASNLALRSLEQIAEEPPPDGESAPRLAEVVREANRVVLRKASGDSSLAGMGTTLTAVLAGAEGRVHVAHVGDSRAYLLRDGEITQLTRDQTVVQRLLDEGRITAEEAEIHPQRSILTNALGVDQDIQVDEASYELKVGDRLLLCSDGLSGMVSQQEIRRILLEYQDPQEASDALVNAANEAGGQDNITAVIIDPVDDGEVGAAPAVDVPPSVGTAEAPTEEREVPAAAAEGAAPADLREPARPVADGAAIPERRPYEFAAGGRRASRGRRIALGILLPLVLIVAALFAVKIFFIDNQWFVAESNGRVALFRGIPAEPLGLNLATLQRETDLPAAEISEFSAWQGLAEGISADSEADAESIVDQMRQDLEERQAQERKQQKDQGTGQQPGGGGGP